MKLFGIPPNLRSLDLLDQILHEIGTPSDLQPMNEYMLFRDHESITARAKINAIAKAVDRLQFSVPDDGQITVYVHYEKINKICTYCTGFFHNVSDCIERNSLLHQHQSRFGHTQNVPFVRHGAWMTQIAAILNSARLMQDQRPTNSLLQRFQQHFATEEHQQLQPGPSRIQGQDAGSTRRGNEVHQSQLILASEQQKISADKNATQVSTALQQVDLNSQPLEQAIQMQVDPITGTVHGDRGILGK